MLKRSLHRLLPIRRALNTDNQQWKQLESTPSSIHPATTVSNVVRSWMEDGKSWMRRTKAITVESMARMVSINQQNIFAYQHRQYPPQPEFHPLSESPHAELRATGKCATQFGSCPVCLDAKDVLPSEEWDALEAIPGGTSKREISPKSRLRPVHVRSSCPIGDIYFNRFALIVVGPHIALRSTTFKMQNGTNKSVHPFDSGSKMNTIRAAVESFGR